MRSTRRCSIFARITVFAHKLPAAKGLGVVKPRPVLQVMYHAQPYCDAALRRPVPARGSACAPVTALPVASHPGLQTQAHRVGIRIDACTLGAAALLRRARTLSMEAVEVGAGPGGLSCEHPKVGRRERWRGLGEQDVVRDGNPLRVTVVGVVPRLQVACEGRMGKTIR
jgi:hypothetical protein